MIHQNILVAVFIITVNLVVFGYFIIVNTAYLILFTLAFFSARGYVRRKHITDLDEVFRSPLTPSISVIIPAFNESRTIVDVVRAALVLRYPRFEVVVVNDGSTDQMLDVLTEAFDLRRITKVVETPLPCEKIRGVFISASQDNLLVLDKAHGGKADSLNAGINVSNGQILCNVDADSLLEIDALLKIARPFLENPGYAVAAGGVIRVVNGCDVSGSRVTRVRLPKGFWANVQIVEYLRAFLGARMGWAALGGLLIVPGAFGAFDRATLLEIGGYRQDTVGEDMELILRLHAYMKEHKRAYKIYYIPDPVCWTQAPVGWQQVSRQRDRWQRGLIESLRAHENMLFNPKYGVPGAIVMPFYFFFEMLGPVVELFGYGMIILALLLHQLDVRFLYLFISVAILYGVIVSLMAVMLGGVATGRFPRLPALAKLSLFAVLDNAGYRQVNTWWRTKAYVTYYTRRRKWGHMERSELAQSHAIAEKDPVH